MTLLFIPYNLYFGTQHNNLRRKNFFKSLLSKLLYQFFTLVLKCRIFCTMKTVEMKNINVKRGGTRLVVIKVVEQINKRVKKN